MKGIGGKIDTFFISLGEMSSCEEIQSSYKYMSESILRFSFTTSLKIYIFATQCDWHWFRFVILQNLSKMCEKLVFICLSWFLSGFHIDISMLVFGYLLVCSAYFEDKVKKVIRWGKIFGTNFYWVVNWILILLKKSIKNGCWLWAFCVFTSRLV